MAQKRLISIERLLEWAVVDQRAQAAFRAGAGPSAMGTSTALVMDMLEIGCRIDTPSRAARQAGTRCHEDALTVFAAIGALPPKARALVVKHARSGTRPEWFPEGAGADAVVLTAKGNPKKRWRNPQTKTGFIGYVTEWRGPRPETVALGRAEWTVWVEALRLLQRGLAGHLKSREPARRGLPPSKPWERPLGRVFEVDQMSQR
jgi:hypothetical protein